MTTVDLFLDAAGGCRGECLMLENVAEHERETLLQMHDEFVGWLDSGTPDGLSNAVGEVACASTNLGESEYPSGWGIQGFINHHNWSDPVAMERLGYYLGQLYENGRERQWAIDKERAEKGWALVHPQGDTTPAPFSYLYRRLDDHERRIATLEAAVAELRAEASL